MTETEIFYTVERETGIDQRFIKSTSRNKDIVRARAMFCEIARSRGFSYPEIGRAINRDHSTVMYLVKEYLPKIGIKVKIETKMEKIVIAKSDKKVTKNLTPNEKAFYDMYGKLPTGLEMNQFMRNRS